MLTSKLFVDPCDWVTNALCGKLEIETRASFNATDIDNFLSKITKNVNIEDDEEYEYNSELSYELYSYSSDEEVEKEKEKEKEL